VSREALSENELASIADHYNDHMVRKVTARKRLRVLRYLPTDFPAQEIAGEPFVSVNTVRTHMRHLYTKLDVHTRAEAVERARTLGLLAPSRGTR
jgi:LuxR family maltose regulon positive regulatory protein